MKDFEKNNWLLVSERFNQYLWSNAFNFFKKTCPLYFHNIYRQSGQNQANTRYSVLKLKHTLRNTCSGPKNLLYLTPIVWNSLPTNLKLTNSLNNFKHKTIFSRNLERWNKISLLIDAVLETSTVIFSINF